MLDLRENQLGELWRACCAALSRLWEVQQVGDADVPEAPVTLWIVAATRGRSSKIIDVPVMGVTSAARGPSPHQRRSLMMRSLGISSIGPRASRVGASCNIRPISDRTESARSYPWTVPSARSANGRRAS